MPRIRRTNAPNRLASNELANRLAEELRSERAFGQPRVEEREYESGLLSIVVLWDEWAPLPAEERSETILEAYRRAESPKFNERIALASGYTLAEARAAGMLPFEVRALVRSSDPVTFRQCREAMQTEGASAGDGTGFPSLRFATLGEAEAAVARLIERLPGSEPVWNIVCEQVPADW